MYEIYEWELEEIEVSFDNDQALEYYEIDDKSHEGAYDASL